MVPRPTRTKRPRLLLRDTADAGEVKAIDAIGVTLPYCRGSIGARPVALSSRSAKTGIDNKSTEFWKLLAIVWECHRGAWCGNGAAIRDFFRAVRGEDGGVLAG